MRRYIILAVALFHLLGTLGAPAVVYSCVESGDSGVSSYVSWSLRSCCVDSCRESHQDTPDTNVRREVPCCDVDLQNVAAHSHVLLPDRQNGPTEACEDAFERLDDVRADVLVAAAPPSTQASHSPVYAPLRI